MHDIKSIRDNPQAFDAGLKRRGLEPMADHVISIDERRRAIIRVLEQNQARRNAASKEVGDAKRAKDDARAALLMAEVTELKESISTLAGEEKAASKELDDTLAAIPNLPLDEVPDGTDERGNVVRHYFGAVRNYAFAPKPHDDLGGALGFMDFETAAKLSGARFVVLTGGLATSDSLIQQILGHGIAAKLSARLGEGLLNGLLTARLGLAAIDVVRPLPFAALSRPTLSDLMSEALRGREDADELQRLEAPETDVSPKAG